MSNAPIQKGGPYLVGFGGFKYTGYVPQDGLTHMRGGVPTNITDENGASMNWVFENPHDAVTVDFVIAGTLFTAPPDMGTVIPIVLPSGSAKNMLLIAPASKRHSRLHTILTLSLIAEDSMSGTYTT